MIILVDGKIQFPVEKVEPHQDPRVALVPITRREALNLIAELAEYARGETR